MRTPLARVSQPTDHAEDTPAAALGFGPHLVFDGRGCPPTRLADLAHLYATLEGLPDRIGMTKIMPPYVFRHSQPGTPEGLSGFVLIAESHISLHTFPDTGHLHADVFSCRTFSAERVLAELKRAFVPRRAVWRVLDRGSEFPKSIARSRAAVAAQRRAAVMRLGLGVTS
jgi:S-adenosylmethionine decarboxylase